jgi:hypothetical protein
MPKSYTIDHSLLGTRMGETIMRGKTMHQTRDAVSDAVASAHELARVAPGSVLSCKCGNGECIPEKCDAVYAHTKDGQHFATIHGLGLQGRKMADGATSIFRMPTGANDAAIDRCTVMIQQRLAAMNEANRIFWAVRDGKEQE